MKRVMHVAAGLMLCGAATDAHATFACQANPAGFLGIDGGGTVLVSVEGTGGRVKLCNIDQELGGVTAKTCGGWYSTLISARMARTTVTLYFDEAHPLNAGSTNCVTLGEWVVRIPYYIEFHP